jgi:hypothetical protein
MKNIWNSQDHSSSPQLDVAAVQERVLQNARTAELEAKLFEYGMIAIFTILGLITLADAIIDREPLYSYVSSLISFGIAGFVLSGRLRRLKQDLGFDQSLLGCLGKAISHVEYQIGRSRTFVWWFVVPSAAATGLSMYYTFHGRPLWVWIIQPLALLLFYVVMQVAVYRQHLPRKKELESIRDQLLTCDDRA